MIRLLSNKNVGTVMVVVAIVALIVMATRSSKYRLSPSPVKVSGVKEGSIFDLPYKLSCVPGPQATASAYTKDLTPGGICGAQEFVADQAEYVIEDGIGGSLLDD
jgi:hypothetical protein